MIPWPIACQAPLSVLPFAISYSRGSSLLRDQTDLSCMSCTHSRFTVVDSLPLVPPRTTGGSEVKASACNAGDWGLIPGSGRSPGEGNGNPIQYSCQDFPWTEEPGSLHCPWSKRLDITEHACTLSPAYLPSLRKLSD